MTVFLFYFFNRAKTIADEFGITGYEKIMLSFKTVGLKLSVNNRLKKGSGPRANGGKVSFDFRLVGNKTANAL